MSRSLKFSSGLLLSVFLCFSAWAQGSDHIHVEAETISVFETGDYADVQLRISVTNGGASVASYVTVVFEDGYQVAIGDVAAGGSATSAQESLSINLSALPTRNQPVPVTLTFTQDGVYGELAKVLVVALQTSEGEGQ